MPRYSERGFAPIVVLVIIVVGIIAGLYLSKNPAIFKPRASETTSLPAEVKAICNDAVLKVSWPQIANENKYNVRGYKTSDANFTAVDTATSRWTDGKNLNDIVSNGDNGENVICDGTSCTYKTSMPPQGGQYRVWVKAGEKTGTQYQNVYAGGLTTCTIPRFVVACDGQKIHVEKVNLSSKEQTNAERYRLRFNNLNDGWNGACYSEAGDFCDDAFRSTSGRSNYGSDYSLPAGYSMGSNYTFWYETLNKEGVSGVSSEQIEVFCAQDSLKRDKESFTSLYCNEDDKELRFYPPGIGQDIIKKFPGIKTIAYRVNNLNDGWDGTCSSLSGDRCVDKDPADGSGVLNMSYVPNQAYEVWFDALDKDGKNLTSDYPKYYIKCGDGTDGVSKEGKVPPLTNPRPVVSCNGTTVTLDIVGDNMSKYDLRLDNLSDTTPWNGTCSSTAGDLCKDGMTDFKTNVEVSHKGEYKMWYDIYDKNGTHKGISEFYKFTCQ